jgi:hypothetical protein
MELDGLEAEFHQSPWAFYNASDLCISVLEGIIPSPRRFLERVFEQWQEFERDDTHISKIGRQHDKAAECRSSEVLLDKREISNPVTTRNEEHGHAPEIAPVEDATSFTSQTVLVGAALIKKVQAMGDSTPGDQARACGYILSRQPQTGDVEAFYAALYEAYRAVRK